MTRRPFRSVLRWHSIRTVFACVGVRTGLYFRTRRQNVAGKCGVTVRSADLVPEIAASFARSWSVTTTNHQARVVHTKGKMIAGNVLVRRLFRKLIFRCRALEYAIGKHSLSMETSGRSAHARSVKWFRHVGH